SNPGKIRAGTIPSQFPLERIHIEMRKDYFAGAGEAHAVNDAGVIGGVRENHVSRPDEGAQHTDVRRIARTKIESRLRSHELRDFGFELLPDLRVAGKKVRAGGSDGKAPGKRGSNR